MDCSIETNLVGSLLCIKINGEIDHHTARPLREKIDEALYYYRPPKIALDLSSVAFMDSSGLGLILGRFTLARELGGELRILDPSDSVSKILELVGTGRLIKIEKTPREGGTK